MSDLTRSYNEDADDEGEFDEFDPTVVDGLFVIADAIEQLTKAITAQGEQSQRQHDSLIRAIDRADGSASAFEDVGQ